MDKEFCSYEQALALKELGFNKNCIGFYMEDDNELCFVDDIKRPENYNYANDFISAPLKQQVFRWFREKHKQSVYPIWRMDNSWDLHIQQLDGYGLLSGQQSLHVVKDKTYEEAEDACIEKLIEIVKQKIKGL